MVNFSLGFIFSEAYDVPRNIHFFHKLQCSRRKIICICVHSIRVNDLSFHTLTHRPCLTFRYMSRGDYKEFELELKFTTLLEAKIHTSGQCFCPDFRLSCTFHHFVKYDTLNGCSCLLWRRQWPCTSPFRGNLRYLWGLNNQCSKLRQFTNKQGIREKLQLFYSSLIVCVHQ